MTGPEHYQQAERLAAQTMRHTDSSDAAVLAALAQAHATLALTAATAMQAAVDDLESGMSSVEFTAWYRAMGVGAQDGDQ